MSNKKTYAFDGEDYSVTWNSGLCIHAEECVRADSKLFELHRKPWGQPDLVDGDELDGVVRRCPTGALAYEAQDGSREEHADTENIVTVAANGPLYVRGDLEIEGDNVPGGAINFRAAFCRCGQSKNKPFCDNSHLKAEFKDSGAVGREGPGLKVQGGKLTVTPKKNGSLLIRGNVSIRSASGSIRWQGMKVSLCRCGLSDSKPFCDGSHRDGNFEADGVLKAADPNPKT